MRIHHLYADANGQSHWGDIEVEWGDIRKGSKLTKRQSVTGIVFRESSGDYERDWHAVPRRQYLINLDNGVKITASDGETRIIGAGEVVLVEDTKGKGHLSQSVNEQVRHSVFVHID